MAQIEDGVNITGGLNRETEISAREVSLEDGRKAFRELREVARQNGVQDMSLEKINAEIQAARSGIKG